MTSRYVNYVLLNFSMDFFFFQIEHAVLDVSNWRTLSADRAKHNYRFIAINNHSDCSLNALLSILCCEIVCTELQAGYRVTATGKQINRDI